MQWFPVSATITCGMWCVVYGVWRVAWWYGGMVACGGVWYGSTVACGGSSCSLLLTLPLLLLLLLLLLWSLLLLLLLLLRRGLLLSVVSYNRSYNRRY